VCLGRTILSDAFDFDAGLPEGDGGLKVKNLKGKIQNSRPESRDLKVKTKIKGGGRGRPPHTVLPTHTGVVLWHH